MATTGNDLTVRIGADTKQAVTEIDRLEARIRNLGVSFNNSKGLNDLAAGITTLTNAMAGFKASDVAKTDFTKLAQSLQNLGRVNLGNIAQTASGLTVFGNAVNALSIDNTKAVTAISGVTMALSRLSTLDTTRLNANIPTVVQSLRNLINSINGLKSLKEASLTSVNALTGLFNAISKLGGKNIANVPENLRQVTKAILEMLNTLKSAPDISTNIVKLVEAISRLNTGTRATSVSVQNSGKHFTSLGNIFNGLTGKTLNLAAAFGKFYASYFLVVRGIRKLWGSIKSSMGFIETYNYFNKSFEALAARAEKQMGEAGKKSAEEFYDEYTTKAKALMSKMSGYTLDADGALMKTATTSLGIDPNAMMNYEAQFASLASSIGNTSDVAEQMSEALTMIGADLASMKNMKFTDTWDNMASGMVGMARAVDKYGINLRASGMQQYLYDMGLKASVSQMNQTDKTLLRTIMILDISRAAWGDLGNTLNQPANQLRMLQANFQQLSRTIGGLFLSSIAALLPYINAVVIALQQLLSELMSVLGITLPKVTSSAANNFDGLLDNVEDATGAMEGASGAAKKLKQNLLGIDELNIIQTGNDAGGAGGFGGVTADLEKAFTDIFEEYKAAWEKARESASNEAEKIAGDILKAVKKGDWKSIGNTISQFMTNQLESIPWPTIYEKANQFGTGLAEFLNGLITPELFGSIGSTAAGYLNTQFYAVGAFIDNFDWKNAGFSLSSMVNNFVEDFDVDQLAHNISAGVHGAIDLAETFLISTDFLKIGQKISDFICGIDWRGLFWDFTELGIAVLEAIGEFILGLFSEENSEGKNVISIPKILFAIEAVGIATAGVVVFNMIKNGLLALWATYSSTIIGVGAQIAIVLAVAAISFEGGLKLGELMSKFGLIPEEDSYWYETFKFDTFFNSVLRDFDNVFNGIILMLNDFSNNPIIAAIGNIMGGWMITWNLDLIDFWYNISATITGVILIFTEFASDIWEIISGAFDDAWDAVTGFFDDLKNNVSKLATPFLNGLITTINKCLEKIDIKIDNPINGETLFEFKVPKIPTINAYANGGYPQMGELFIANERGPELIGTMNGKSAVASNNEITGIKEAIYSVATDIIAEMRNNETTVVLEGDAKGMFRQMRSEAKSFQRTTGTQAFSF